MSKYDDPVMAEAVARAAESRAQILRSKAASNPAFAHRAEAAARDATNAARRVDGLPEVHPDPEGTSTPLADSEGNFPANNTEVATGEPAQTVEQAGEAAIAGDQAVGAATTETAATIPANWQELSWQERRSLASKLSDTPISNGEEANAAIEAELKRRATA